MKPGQCLCCQDEVLTPSGAAGRAVLKELCRYCLALKCFIPKGTSTKECADSTAPAAKGLLLEELSHFLWGVCDERCQHCQQLLQCRNMPVH